MTKYKENPAYWVSPEHFQLVDPDEYTYQGFIHSLHSKKRASQRNIHEEAIITVIDYGRLFHKQGMRFFVAVDRDLPDWLTDEQRRQVRDLVVVLSGDENEIVTCYRNSRAYRYIRKKGRKLL